MNVRKGGTEEKTEIKIKEHISSADDQQIAMIPSFSIPVSQFSTSFPRSWIQIWFSITNNDGRDQWNYPKY